MFSEYLRRNIFWCLDSIKGGKIRNHYNDVKNRMENNIAPDVRDILRYAQKNVPYYSKYSSLDLHDYPVMNKEIYNQNKEQMFSKEYKDNDNLHWFRTSGSTGTPFEAPQDTNKRNRTIADLLYFHDISNWHLGMKYVFLRAWVAYNANWIKRIKQNFIPFEAVNFDDNQKSKLLKTIKKNRNIQVVFGYSSLITELAEYMISKNEIQPNKNIKLVVVDSDDLSPKGKQLIERAFGCSVMNRYDNEEQGVLACMLPSDDFWTVNTASHYIEILKLDEDVPCEAGEIGRVVVTDLTNRAFPFIRYDVGDLARCEDYDGTYVRKINSLEGKAQEMLHDVSGNSISNVTFAAYFELFMEIRKYQIIQETAKDYLIKVVIKQGKTLDKQKLVDKFKECLGQDAEIKVEEVDMIETTTAGKYRPVLNKYRRNN